MKKILVVTLASLALAIAVNFGLASAHPFADPTPPATPAPGAPLGADTDVEQEGDHQDGNMDEPQAGDKNESDMNESGGQDQTEDAAGNPTTTTGQGQQGDQGQQDRNTEQDGEFEGDN